MNQFDKIIEKEKSKQNYMYIFVFFLIFVIALLLLLYFFYSKGVNLVITPDNVSKSLDISDEIKLPILKEIGFAQLRVSEGLSTLCQLVSLIGYLCKIKPK